MKEFFDTLDERMFAFFKSFSKKPKGPTPEQLLDPDDIGAPIFLMVGSLSGCTLKDAESYARGLAETYVVSPQLGRIHVYDDKEKGRFVYEIHEGGPEQSIVEKVIAQLAEGKKVRIRLTNGATAVIEEANNEVFSLVYPAEKDGTGAKLPGLEYGDLAEGDDLTVHEVAEYCSETPLEELFPENRKLANIGGVVLGVAVSLFVLTGGIYTVVASEILDGDILFRQAKNGQLSDATDNPVWQLEKARIAAEKDGQSVRALKKGPTGWSWDLSAPAKANDATATTSTQTPPVPPAPTPAPAPAPNQETAQ